MSNLEQEFRQRAEAAARAQRAVQAEVDSNDRAAKPAKHEDKAKPPVQAGVHDEPANPLPAQHLSKPGNEQDLELQPRFLAEAYKGSGKLSGSVALITGGDSGIGRAVAVLFAREGADVAICYLNEHEDAAATKAHVEAEGRRCITLSGDVRERAFCDYAVKRTVEAFGGLHVLVNNAAFQLHAASLGDISDAHLALTLETNIGGYFNMARAALPHLGRGASIINTSSETGLLGNPKLLDYSATKGAINAFTLSLARNLIDRGIRVNAVAPGPVWTPLNPADKPAAEVARFGQESDMRRPAQPEEISPAYVFLASAVTGSYVNGVILPVMGGPGG